MRLFLLLSFLIFLAGCSGTSSLDQEKLSDQEFNLEEFFAGETKAYGQFQDVLGRVSRRFEVDIAGKWDGTNLRLVEDFTYSDGTTEQRIWTLVKTGAETWTGTAKGVIGQAKGVESGDTFNWAYTIDLPTPDGSVRVAFDDWMWLLADNRVLNKAYMSRYGVKVGEVTIMFEKH